MQSLPNWEPIAGLPDTLEKILKETEINNSFRDEAVGKTLTETMESSFAFLYRTQRDSITYKRFHYQTREYLLNTTYNDIHMGLKKYGDILMELEKAETPDLEEIARVKRILAEFGEVRFGDLYLDDKRRVCTKVEHDMIRPEYREAFRTSKYYKQIIPVTEMLMDSKTFREIPIVIMDGEVRFDVGVTPLEKGTRLIMNHMNAKSIYTNTGAHKFHDFTVMFVPNNGIEFTIVNKDTILSKKIPYDTRKNELKKGLYFICIKANDKSTHLIPVTQGILNGRRHVEFKFDKRITSLVDSHDGDFEVAVIFFTDLYRVNFEATPDGTIPSYIREYITDETYEARSESRFFTPEINAREMLSMPVPEKNMLVMKAVYEGTSVDRYEPAYDVGVKLYYPNLYQVTDPIMDKKSKYTVYFFYKDIPEVKYTSVLDFYWSYMKGRFNDVYTVAEIVNMIYFREHNYNVNRYLDKLEKDFNGNYIYTESNVDDDVYIEPHHLLTGDDLNLITLVGKYLDAFYAIFEKVLNYNPYDYKYGTPDFISDYIGEKIPRQYKIARMMEFVKADWNTLPKYVKNQRRKETMFHFFTNTINLKGRVRRSTRLEDKVNAHYMFATAARITTPDNPNAYYVTDSKSYNFKTEVHIDDAKLLLPNVTLGSYVEFDDLVDRYVFAFKNPGKEYMAMKVFVDGILCANAEVVNSLGMDFIYIPCDMVNKDSYIMMELDWTNYEPQVTQVTFSDREDWQTVHIIENENVEYTMNDIVLKFNGRTIKPEFYSKRLVRHEVPYEMYDERHELQTKYGIVTDFSIQLTAFNADYPCTVDVIVNKSSVINSGVAHRNTYPRFHLNPLKLNPDVNLARMYYNGRLAPKNAFRLIDSEGRTYIQSRIFYQKGDSYLFELSPYAKQVVCKFTEFDPDGILDLSEYLDKPLDPEYYEIYANGRRLGLPNVFPFGPHKAVFKGLKTKYLLDIYEKERDFEYFGFSKVFKDGESYFYLVSDLVEENFIAKREIDLIIDRYIDLIKHEKAVIKPNDPVEEPVYYEIEDGLIEEMKIFFFEELLPLGLGNPDELQFNKKYFSEVFPNFSKVFLAEGVEGPPVIFLNPDVTVRFHGTYVWVENEETGSVDLEKLSTGNTVIKTKEAIQEQALVLLTGESGVKKGSNYGSDI